jgi:mRNA interferase MazF
MMRGEKISGEKSPEEKIRREETPGEITRGEIWWADLPDPRGSEPGFRRPVLVIQANSFNRSRIQTVIVAVISSNLRLADAPGNVLLTARVSGLPKDSVINVSQLLTLDRSSLTEEVGKLPNRQMQDVDTGLRLVLEL